MNNRKKKSPIKTKIKPVKNLRKKNDLLWTKILTITAIIFAYLIPVYAALWYSLTKTWTVSRFYRDYEKYGTIGSIILGVIIFIILFFFSAQKEKVTSGAEQPLWKKIRKREEALLVANVLFWSLIIGFATMVTKIVKPLL